MPESPFHAGVKELTPSKPKKRYVSPANLARIAAGYGGRAGLERLSKEVEIPVSSLRAYLGGYVRPTNEQKAFRIARRIQCDPKVLLYTRKRV